MNPVDVNAVVDSNVTQLNSSNVSWIVDVIRVIVDLMFGFLSVLQDLLISGIMAFDFTEFQSKVLITVIVLAVTVWKAGSLAELVDKARWFLLIILLLLGLGVITGVIQ